MMKQLIRLVFLSTLFATIQICANNCYPMCCLMGCDDKSSSACWGYPYIAYRSQSVNAARDLVGWQTTINRYGMEELYGSFAVTAEYTRSFRPSNITRMLFGQDVINCNQLKIQGSLVENRHKKAWLADYFGLPMDFDSTLYFCPQISNIILDFNLYLGLDQWAEGLYFRIHAPLVHSKWNLNMCEKINNKGAQGFFNSYMKASAISVDDLAKSFTQVMKGDYTFGDMKEPIRFGLINNCCCKKTKLADMQAALGWNFVLEEDKHFGFNLRASAPLGNKPNGKYIFSPIIGNGKHWELGIGLTGSKRFCECEEEENRFCAVYFDANLTHLFKSKQCRSFDLFCKPNSRYMLLEEIGENKDDLRGDEPACSNEINYQYAGNLIPAINAFTFCLDVEVAAQFDMAIKLSHVRNCWSFDIGYNLWARTGENFIFNCDCQCDKKYAIKGDAYLYGAYTVGFTDNIYTAGLSATQSKADIHSGLNYPLSEGEKASGNPRIDNPETAYVRDEELISFEGVNINTSVQPVLLSIDNIATLKSPAALTNKLFAHINYMRTELEEHKTKPYIGFGGEIEFAGKNISKSGISQWGIWLKGGLSFE